MKVEIDKVYKHFKGNLYKILVVAIDSETLESVVVYKALYGEEKVWVRPLKDFVSLVDTKKYPNIKQKYRFERQD